MLGNRAHEGLQPPSNLEERKGLKETQHAAHVHSEAHPHCRRSLERQFTYRKRTDRVAFPLEYSPKVYQSVDRQ